MAAKQVWTTASIIKETKDTITVVFNTEGISFSYIPGQFINVTLLIDDLPVTRSYSLSSTPNEDIYPSITIKRVKGGVMSNFIIDNISTISKWYIDGPYGNFIPTESSYTAGHIILMAGGSGITPLYSICRSILTKSPNTKITLIYSSRNAEDIIFKTPIERLTQRFKDRLISYHVLSQPKDITQQSKITVINGRIKKVIASKLIKRVTGDSIGGVQFFICGPDELMKMYREVLKTMQVPAEQIFMEWFKPETTNEPVTLPLEPKEVLLHFFEQTNLLDVQAGQTILAAAREDKIPISYSCKEGTCGKCTAKLISGQVKMINNYYLKQEDVNAGMILLCQSYPLNNDVTVEVA
jgi:ring-1,2-phenylacetyl-CoA epoxidase subunit PaaE